MTSVAFINKHEIDDFVRKQTGLSNRLVFKKICITKDEFNVLTSSGWFFDSIINYYLELVTDYAKFLRLKVGSLNTANSLFFVKESLENTVAKLNEHSFLNQDLFFIPLHVNGNHWSLIVFEKKKLILEYWDSMNSHDSAYAGIIKKLVKSIEHMLVQKTKRISKINVEIINCQKQDNDYDCGMFVCLFARNRLFERTFKINKETLSIFRLIIAHEIIEKKILYHTNVQLK
ncbi:Protease, Ulp1 family [Pseudoloma neurophilia]|uniref:Protease, Ulp1 family n=1 Tax=Pseudoloma neurophilia TaxID=146866 RepID=A0A0R0M5C7_9MICR|nr:Protease, Ulp1 family [Pseudoloma neurophilia]